MARLGTTSHCLLWELDLDNFLIDRRHLLLLLLDQRGIMSANLDPLLLLLSDAHDTTVMMGLLVLLVALRTIRSEI